MATMFIFSELNNEGISFYLGCGIQSDMDFYQLRMLSEQPNVCAIVIFLYCRYLYFLEMDNDAHIIHRADELYTNNDIDGLYTYLSKYKDSNNDQLLWRLARACCDKAKDIEDKNQKRLLIFLAFDYAGRALELNDKNFACHKVIQITKLLYI